MNRCGEGEVRLVSGGSAFSGLGWPLFSCSAPTLESLATWLRHPWCGLVVGMDWGRRYDGEGVCVCGGGWVLASCSLCDGSAPLKPGQKSPCHRLCGSSQAMGALGARVRVQDSPAERKGRRAGRGHLGPTTRSPEQSLPISGRQAIGDRERRPLSTVDGMGACGYARPGSSSSPFIKHSPWEILSWCRG